MRPSAWKLRTRSRHLAWNASSPTASTSSISRMSGSTCTATANPSRTSIPDEKNFTWLSMKSCELGERDDLVVDAIGVLAREPEERRVEVDVLAAR